MNNGIYKITLVNGDWYVISSDITDGNEFIEKVYSGKVNIFNNVIDKNTGMFGNSIGIVTDKIATIEWVEVEQKVVNK